MKSLVGKWRLVREGSDFLPGVDNLVGAPLSSRLSTAAAQSAEYLKIGKRRSHESEEIHIAHVAKNVTSSVVYQIGTINYESVSASPGVIIATVQCCSDFVEFTISRLGPHFGQSSRETYLLNERTGEVKLLIEVISGDGTHLTLINYLTRVDDSGAANVDSVLFLSSSRSLGWGLYEYWPSSLLTQCSALIVKAVKLRLPTGDNSSSNGGSSGNNNNNSSRQSSNSTTTTTTTAKLGEVLWRREAFHDDFHVDLSLLPRHFGGAACKEGEEVVIFIVQVFFEGHTWYLARRYSEFDALKTFLLQQNPYNALFKQAALSFPGKSMLSLGLSSYRKQQLERRVQGLGEFLTFFLKNAKFGRQNSVDALLAFLIIPESVANTHNPDAPRAPAAAAAAVKERGNPSEKMFSSALAAANCAHNSSSSSNSNGAVVDYSQQQLAHKMPVTHSAVTQQYQQQQQQKKNTAAAIAGSASGESKQQENSKMPTSAAVAVATAKDDTSLQGPILTTVTTAASAAALPTRNPRPARLKALLRSGLKITKHGRSGAPKVRTLLCNSDCTALFWDDNKHQQLSQQQQQQQQHSKMVKLCDVTEVRLGTDIDPETPQHLLLRAANDANSSALEELASIAEEDETDGGGGDGDDRRSVGSSNAPSSSSVQRFKAKMKRKSSFFRKDKILLGTSILRRNCRQPEDFQLCVSLILPDRTLDIQCFKIEEFEELVPALREACGFR